MTLKDTIPPSLALLLAQHQLQNALATRVTLQCPQRVVQLNRLRECCVNQCACLAFDLHLCARVRKLDRQLLARQTSRQPHVHSHILETLLPIVQLRLATVSRIWLLALVFPVILFFFSWLSLRNRLSTLLGCLLSLDASSFFLGDLSDLSGLLLLLLCLSCSSLLLFLGFDLGLFLFKRLFARLLLLKKIDVACKRLSHRG
jgi:hypothetical protein